MARNARMAKEMKMLETPPPGISCWAVGDKLDNLEACILGVKDTCFESGNFKLKISIPTRYPFEPPAVSFLTRIYHPNIDNAGRICLDLLKMPPIGSWKPSMNLRTVLTSIQLLMSEPNPEDPLMADIAAEFKSDRSLFNHKARESTRRYAMPEAATSKGTQKQEKGDKQALQDRSNSNTVS
eukprot:m.83965 g.83965  ORF g.83965 m.83965 type:complete len:182 (+) comp12946_c0_seq8:377-922(+)